jgi:hypothetical protein
MIQGNYMRCKFVDIFRGHSEFRILTAAVHFEQDIAHPFLLSGESIYLIRESQGIHGVDESHGGNYVFHLVPLQVSYHVKAMLLQLIPLSQVLLHTIFADFAEARLENGIDALGRLCLGHDDKENIFPPASTAFACTKNTTFDMLDAFCKHKTLNISGLRLNSKAEGVIPDYGALSPTGKYTGRNTQ